MQRNASENVEITWRSQYVVTYCVEASTDDYGGSMTWTVVDDNVESGGAVTTWEDTDTPTSGKKFYRVCIKGTGGRFR